jgi:hypothetical protein
MRQINGRCSDKRTLAELLPKERPPSARLSVEINQAEGKGFARSENRKLLQSPDLNRNSLHFNSFRRSECCWVSPAVAVF